MTSGSRLIQIANSVPYKFYFKDLKLCGLPQLESTWQYYQKNLFFVSQSYSLLDIESHTTELTIKASSFHDLVR